MTAAPLHNETATLLFSRKHAPVSVAGGIEVDRHQVFLKLDCDQPSSSFKIRGVGVVAQQAVNRSGSATHLVSSSSGNAGMAVAYAASKSGVGATIYVPVTTELDVVGKLEQLGARVVIGGASWDGANQAAQTHVDSDPAAVYIHPFEGDATSEGHSGLVDELYRQLPLVTRPSSGAAAWSELDVIICSVGGGGLIRGILKGCRRLNKFPTVVAVQNFGTDSFNQSFNSFLARNDGNARAPSPQRSDLVTLAAITSKCTSMGARTCSFNTFEHAVAYHVSGGEIVTLTVTDDLSASACWQFAQHTLQDGRPRRVELSCASSLTPLYHPSIFPRIIAASPKLKARVAAGDTLRIAVEVCGGSKISPALLEQYELLGTMPHADQVSVNGVLYPKLTP